MKVAKLNEGPLFLVHTDNLGATQTKICPFVNGNEKTFCLLL